MVRVLPDATWVSRAQCGAQPRDLSPEGVYSQTPRQLLMNSEKQLLGLNLTARDPTRMQASSDQNCAATVSRTARGSAGWT
jgi:hypothetical protein